MFPKMTYRAAGVDIDKANAFVSSIQTFMKGTLSPDVISRKGSFGALYALRSKKIRDPVIVSSTDGVGTKLLIAQAVNKHDTVGIDLVAMNVNDILCVGAEPLFFLDYIACGKINTRVLKAVVSGIARGCRLAGCSLIGGETAEMPAMYASDEYDLAGFAVGIVDRKDIIDGSSIQEGDQVIGLPSSGLHSNGFSLVRRVFSIREQNKMATELLKPTRIYTREVLALKENFAIRGIAHITGGAYYEKLTKILPPGLCFQIDKASWPIPEIFLLLQDKAKIEMREMYRTFNMGIGLVIVVRAKDYPRARLFLQQKRIRAYEIGRVVKNRHKIIF